MRDNIKHHLDASIPNHITLTQAQKRKILHEGTNRLEKKRFKLQTVPIIVSLAIISLSLFLVIPYIQDWLEKDLSQLFEESLREVTIPDFSYSSLIRSIYVNETKEMIFTDWNGIYSYSVDINTKKILVEPKEESQIHQIAVNENWLAWEEITTSTLNVLNRTSNEIIELSNTHVGDIILQDDTLLIMDLFNSDSDNFMGYRAIDLYTMKQRDVHEFIGTGSHSLAAVKDNLLVVPEELEKEGDKVVKFYLYDIEKNTRLGEYEVPYEIAELVTLTDHKIFAQFSKKDENAHLGYIDLESGKLHKIKTPPFSEFAVFENYVALSIIVKDTTTLKLYKIVDHELKELPAFKNISERLVRPRFIDNGTLLVNGEGEQKTMYLQEVNFAP